MKRTEDTAQNKKREREMDQSIVPLLHYKGSVPHFTEKPRVRLKSVRIFKDGGRKFRKLKSSRKFNRELPDPRDVYSSGYAFEPIDLNRPEYKPLRERTYNTKETRNNRFKSMAHFLFNLCQIPNAMSEHFHYPTTARGKCMLEFQKKIEFGRRATGFFEHVVDVYNRQKGLCSFTGAPLLFPKNLEESKSDLNLFFASIDRIWDDFGYEYGNICLTLRFINRAKANFGCRQLKMVILLSAIGSKADYVKGTYSANDLGV